MLGGHVAASDPTVVTMRATTASGVCLQATRQSDLSSRLQTRSSHLTLLHLWVTPLAQVSLTKDAPVVAITKSVAAAPMAEKKVEVAAVTKAAPVVAE